MYSRRLLIDNYSKFHKLEKENPIVIDNDNKKFIVYENEYGTYFYYQKLFNALELMELDAKYYFINSVFLTKDNIKNILNGSQDEVEMDNGFLYKETIYKLKEGNND
jgi:hypothetical protein